VLAAQVLANLGRQQIANRAAAGAFERQPQNVLGRRI
jgi:hypothetical protein